MKIDHIRIYPRGEGFDLFLRVRGGIMKQGNFPTLQDALDHAWKLGGRKKGQPIYVYEADFSTSIAEAFAPAFGGIAGGAE